MRLGGRDVKLREWPAADLFEDDNVNWHYCEENAHFVHQDACEFIIHLYLDDDASWESDKAEMQQYGCTQQFITELETIRQAGYEKVLLWC